MKSSNKFEPNGLNQNKFEPNIITLVCSKVCENQMNVFLIPVLKSLFLIKFFQTITQIVFFILYDKESNQKNIDGF